MSYLSLYLFALAWAVGIYIANCLLARQIKHINPKIALLYITSLTILGPLGEVLTGYIYHFLFHSALWHYTVYPIYNGYTSQYAVFLWAIYGFHIYLIQDTIKKRKTYPIHILALLFCFEAIIIEALTNLTFKASFGQYIYYYYPADLWHITSFWVLPFYLVAGYALLTILKKFRAAPMFFAAICACTSYYFVFKL